MATSVVNKRKHDNESQIFTPENLFVDAPADESDGSDIDTTDSEESIYSGLEEEEDTDSDDLEFEEIGESDNDEQDEDIVGFEKKTVSTPVVSSQKTNKKSLSKISNLKNLNISGINKIKAKGKGKGKHSQDLSEGSAQNGKPVEKKLNTTNIIAENSLEKVDNETDKIKNESSGVDNQKDENSNPVDEYEVDSSDEEDIRNTIGNIPIEWYRDYAHIGYDTEGRKIIKPQKADELDEFLEKMDNPDYWRTVKDRMTGQNVYLTDQDIDTIERVKSGKYPDAKFDPYEKWIDFFTHEKMIHPVTNRPEHKRSFIPSRLEKMQVSKYVHAMKMGWIKPKKPKTEDEENRNFYMLWQNDESEMSKRMMMHIPAPKLTLPGHAESYNPPPEYLFTEEEKLAWKNKDPEDRRMNFMPKSYSSLRLVPSYKKFVNERFLRCLDLYLCPRQRKMRMNVDPEDLLPKLPKPKDLQPFPTSQAIVYTGHTGLVRCISVDPSGQWLASGSDDGTLKFWEILTGRCMRTLKAGGLVKSIEWNPNPLLCLAAFVVDNSVVIVNPRLADKVIITSTDNMMNNYVDDPEADVKTFIKWEKCTPEELDEGMYLRVNHPKAVSQVTWHAKGDYFSVVMPQADSKSVIIHQLSKRRSQNPFKKSKGLVQKVLFHPTKPFFFVATQRYVRVYNLVKQELMKKLLTNCKWVSSIAIHPAGDNVIIGSYDTRLAWFDLDLSTKPYQTLRHHKQAIRQVTFHRRYPLFASASDDGTVIVCHGMVYNDLLQNPLIVPVKILRGHTPTKDLGVLDCQFHPTQPWLFSSGSDCTIRLFT